MKILSYLGYLFLALTIISCSANSGGTEAEVSEAKEVQDVEATVSYNIVTDNSKVGWIGTKPTGQHIGYIPISMGTIKLKDDQIVGGTITMDVANIQNEDLADKPESQEKLINHLKSDDFFHADSFPTAEFVITSVEAYNIEDKPEGKEQFQSEYTPASADEFVVESPTHTITGNLTMRGKTLSVAFPANVKINEDEIIAKAKFNIDRTNWGLMYGDEASVVDKTKD
ncbi:MAG: YceI family protein, partial [Fulvivirga sp.]|nr:YceI family protein [Fulvivirga sp.]